MSWSPSPIVTSRNARVTIMLCAPISLEASTTVDEDGLYQNEAGTQYNFKALKFYVLVAKKP